MSKHRTHGRMWNRLVSGVLCLALVLGLLPAAGLVQPAEAANWADPYGQQLVEWGVMRGDISGNLNLANPITRAEFVTMCNRAFGYSKMGTIPFTDVVSTDWYAEDINIAYNAGYFKGTTSNLASPKSNLTREQAAVLLARIMLLQETSGESLGFSDSRTLSEWSRGLISAAVAEGMLTGYSDGSFRPTNPITRGEVAAMLVRVIGTPVSEGGNKSLGDVYGNVTISTSNVSLRNTTIAGNLYITGGVDLGNVLLENVTVLGRIIISGGGESEASKDSITLRNVEAEELIVDSMVDQFVTILVQGVSDIPVTRVRTNAYLNDSSWQGYGLTRIEQDGASLLQVAGLVKEVVNLTPSSDLQLVQGSAERITIDELATNSQLTITRGTRVDELNLDVATLVTGDEMGKGDIKNLNVGASGSEVDILPDVVEIRPGTTATIEGEKMDSVAAAELSTEPHILAGYPAMVNVAPTEAEAQFGGNKPGTIYWAISSLADGSVSEDDLISNPSYGSNIYEEQAGSRDVSAKTIYSEKVEKLTADGSYYISAIMVDGRGKRSPLKVAAFTTPDDTVPAFVGTPEITKATTTVAQVTATANKDCLLYWALLPKGAAAPTAQQFKTGSVGSNYGYGNLSVVKNAPTSITVNSRRLMEKTEYVLYLWLTDHNGAKSMATPLALPLITPDETPPIVTGVEQVAPFGTNTADVTYAINEAPATLYWAVVAQGNTTFIALSGDPEEDAALLSDLRTKIKVESGASAGAIAGGSSSVAEAYTNAKFTVSGLDPAKYGNNFTLYYVGKDAAGNYSDMVGSISIQTLDTTPPTVVDPPQFTSYNGDKATEPLADSGIKLIFSEQVKGGANASRTFLELYNATLDPNVDEETRKAAVATLDSELSAHIKLYQLQSGNAVLMNGNTEVINFANAIVTQENDGTMVIFLPGESDKNTVVGNKVIRDPAVSLDSGASYYFELIGVFDNAFTPNGISKDGTTENPTGNLKMSEFRTVYAQVNLEWNTRVSKAGDGTRLDIVVDVKPTSTEKVPETECWDMIMWSDKTIEIQVYKLVLGPGGENDIQEAWTPLNANAAPITVSQNNPTPGIGLGTQIITGDWDKKYPVIKTSLDQGYTYRYGIHISKVGTVSETNPKEEADSWSDLVTMHFALIAGAQGQVYNASAAVRNNFDNNFNIIQNPKNISYISTAGTGEVLEASKQFLDTRVPSFTTQFPTFTPGSSSITMQVALNRPGTVYYVAAPAGAIPTRLPDGTDITTTVGNVDGNDGTGSSLVGRSYIPTSGGDRAGKEPTIHFLSGGEDGGRGVYASPDYTDIMGGNFANGLGVFVPDEPITYTNQVVSRELTGLRPDTMYYVYVVLQGGGTADRVVEIYRVKTNEVKVPAIDVQQNGSTSATIIPDQDSELAIALVELNRLPTSIFGSYYDEDHNVDKDSIIYRMITPDSGSNGASMFDKYTGGDDLNGDGKKDTADDVEAMKAAVANYVLGTDYGGTGALPQAAWKLYEGASNNGESYNGTTSAYTRITWDVANEMTAIGSEYVLLVVGRHPYGGTVDAGGNRMYSGGDYGFGAIKSLFLDDTNPPEFSSKNATFMGVNALLPVGYKDFDANERQEWLSNPIAYAYEGYISLTFSKELYWRNDTTNIRNPLTYTMLQSGNILGGTAVRAQTVTADGSGAVGQEIVLHVTGIRSGQTILIPGSGHFVNSSGYPMQYTVELTFDPTLTAADTGGYGTLLTPAFKVRILSDSTN